MIPDVSTIPEVADVEIPPALHTFQDASLELLGARALQERVDRKYLMPIRVLNALLVRLSEEYRVLRSNGELAARYHTIYFDTPERRMYHEHRRGRRPRYKVRVRHHVDRRMSFLEIKRKGPDERTTKARLGRPFGATDLSGAAGAFIEQRCPVRATLLSPQLSVTFRRITIVGESVNERITFDCGVAMDVEGRREAWPRVVVAEIKQARYSNTSPSVHAFRELHVRERAISKYCLATASLAVVRSNTFRPALRAVEQLSA